MKILVAGFDIQSDETINPAYEAVKLLPDEICGCEIIKCEIPTVFGAVIDYMDDMMRRVMPDAVLAVGEAGGRPDITVERVAVNLNDSRRRDNDGKQPVDERIFEDGETAYFSNLPVKSMVEAIRGVGLPASVSDTAGTYVCNNVMYGILYLISKRYGGVKGGFIHVPFAPEQCVFNHSGAPTMSLHDTSRGLEAAVEAVINDLN